MISRWVSSRTCAALTAGCLWLGCDTRRDVIAFDPRVDEGYFSKDAAVPTVSVADAGSIGRLDGSVYDAGQLCSSQDKQLYFLDNEGALYIATSPEAVSWLGFTNCWYWARSKRTQVPAMIDIEHKYWLAPYADDGAGLHWDDGSCSAVTSTLDVSALTSIIEPQLLIERVYALQSGQLYELDSRALAQRAIGRLDASFLVGNANGQLFAIQERDQGFLSVGSVSRTEALFSPIATVAQPNDGPLLGVAAWGSDLLLLFGTELYKLSLATRDFGWFAHVQLPVVPRADGGADASFAFLDGGSNDGSVPQIVAMFAPACASQK